MKKTTLPPPYINGTYPTLYLGIRGVLNIGHPITEYEITELADWDNVIEGLKDGNLRPMTIVSNLVDADMYSETGFSEYTTINACLGCGKSIYFDEVHEEWPSLPIYVFRYITCPGDFAKDESLYVTTLSIVDHRGYDRISNSSFYPIPGYPGWSVRPVNTEYVAK